VGQAKTAATLGGGGGGGVLEERYTAGPIVFRPAALQCLENLESAQHFMVLLYKGHWHEIFIREIFHPSAPPRSLCNFVNLDLIYFLPRYSRVYKTLCIRRMRRVSLHALTEQAESHYPTQRVRKVSLRTLRESTKCPCLYIFRDFAQPHYAHSERPQNLTAHTSSL
jgi:hypothetical protein